MIASDVVFVTVSTRNYVHRAYALMASVGQLVPDAMRLICCADGELPGLESVGEDIHHVNATSLGIERYAQLVFCLNPTAICCLLKPYAVAKALEIPNARRVIYLDNDVALYDSPVELLQALQSSDFVLTPHHLKPLPPNSCPSEAGLCGYGTYNGGMFGVSRSCESLQFLDWWSFWMLDPRHLNRMTGYDQVWLNYVPVYCPDFAILRKPGYNVAFWNLVERNLDISAGRFHCGNDPLVAFHFSHFDEVTHEDILPDDRVSNCPRGQATRSLASNVAMKWAQYRRHSTSDYAFSNWDDGTAIGDEERERARNVWDELDPMEDPWTDSGADSRNGRFSTFKNQPVPTGIKSQALRSLDRLLDVSPRKVIRKFQ